MSDISGTSSTPTGMTGAGGGNMLRITGMASGLDVDSMVKKMLASDQTKIDQVKKQQQIIQWKQQAYQTIITDVKSLQSSFFDVTNPSTSVLSQNNYNNLTASSSSNSVASATAATTAAAGSYTLNVTNVANAAAITGSSMNSQVTVNAANLPSSWANKIDFSVTTSGTTTTQTLDLTGFSGTTVSSLASYINNQITNNAGLSGKLQASYVKDTSGSEYIKFTSLTSSSVQVANNPDTPPTELNGLIGKNLTTASLNSQLTSLSGGTALNTKLTLNLLYNGNEVSVNLDNTNGTATVGDLVTAISNATGGQVTGKFDDMTGKFTLQTTATGSSSTLQIEDQLSTNSATTSTNGLLTALGLNNVKTGNLYSSSQGTDATVQITPPGATTATTLTESSNNFTVNGVSYSLTGTGSTTISVTSNTQQVHDMIKNFLDKYNSIVQEIQDKLNEKKDYNYPPLTDSQKSQMSATDITNWNNKAQQGILNNDDNLRNLLTNLRQAFTTPLSDANGSNITTLNFGNYGSGAIGLDTSNDISKAGTITISDDQKLNNAIAQNPQQFMQLFTNVSNITTTSTDPSSTYFKGSGIFQRINTILQSNVGLTGVTLNNAILTKYANLQDDYSVSGGAGSGTMADQIYTKQLLINTLTTQMSNDQTKYYDQFSKLETAISQLNAQQATLTSMSTQ